MIVNCIYIYPDEIHGACRSMYIAILAVSARIQTSEQCASHMGSHIAGFHVDLFLQGYVPDIPPVEMPGHTPQDEHLEYQEYVMIALNQQQQSY